MNLDMRFYVPVVTGNPDASALTGAYQRQAKATVESVKAEDTSFEQMLRDQLNNTGGVCFSKHALKRTAERNMTLSQESLARLNEGVRLAEEKNLGDTLIMVDQMAFLVNVKNQTVITAVNNGDKASVFTNIDGTVIV